MLRKRRNLALVGLVEGSLSISVVTVLLKAITV